MKKYARYGLEFRSKPTYKMNLRRRLAINYGGSCRQNSD